MPSLSDNLLDSGCVTHIGAVHGFNVEIETGLDAGKTFFANTVEIEADIVLTSELTEDRRAKRVIRFQDSRGVPRLGSQDIIKIDGKRWNAVRNPGDAYLTTDFELKEIATGKDT